LSMALTEIIDDDDDDEVILDSKKGKLPDIPKPPKGWMDKDYYDEMYTSYNKGGKLGVKTKEVQHSFLEKLKSCKMWYVFTNKYRHPFAHKLGIPHFNPYGHVPQDPKGNDLDWQLYVEMGAVGDYNLYLDVMYCPDMTPDTTLKCDACQADKIVTKEESHEKEVSKASSLKTQLKKPKTNLSECVKPSKASTLGATSGKVVKPMTSKENANAKALNFVKKVTHLELDEDSEEELPAKTHKLLAMPSVLPPTMSLYKSPHMQVEVILKSPAPAKPKNGKSSSAIKAKSKLQHAPTANHNSDEEVVEEPQCKHKAQDSSNEPPAKQQ
ncbi:hypothetical protein FRC11_012226, partial [Ceratobasidium sp. 423]